MLMSEKEAKSKWCPMARSFWSGELAQGAATSYNRATDNTKCVASKCMMWRWRLYTKDVLNNGEVVVKIPIEDYGGFCGLAGKL